MTTVITNIPLYRAIAVRQAIQFYARTGMKVNSAYTPTNMLRVAGEITGQTFKRGRYADAIEALTQWIEARQTDGETLETRASHHGVHSVTFDSKPN